MASVDHPILSSSFEMAAIADRGGYGFNGGLGERHGANLKMHSPLADYVFQYGYWLGGSEPGPRNPRNPRGR